MGGEPGGGSGNDLLSQRHAASIVGAGALHDRVREGNGWAHPAPVTAPAARPPQGRIDGCCIAGESPQSRGGAPAAGANEAPSVLSTASLRRLPAFHGRPIHQLISLGPYGLTPWETSSWGELRT